MSGAIRLLGIAYIYKYIYVYVLYIYIYNTLQSHIYILGITYICPIVERLHLITINPSLYIIPYSPIYIYTYM